MSVDELLDLVRMNPATVEFEQVMDVIAQHYDYTPATFHNGETCNEAGTNEGSCKIFAFAQLNNLNKNQVLSLFGKYYRNDVLSHPAGTDHANIRNFMQHGWHGIKFEHAALARKN